MDWDDDEPNPFEEDFYALLNVPKDVCAEPLVPEPIVPEIRLCWCTH
jgi:hypothetical protein